MADESTSAPDPRRAAARRRLAAVFGVIALLGFAGGAAANVGIARLLALPEGAEAPAFVDAEIEEGGPKTPAREVPAGEEPEPEAEDRGPVASAGRALPKKSYADAIVRRNIFDSTAVYNPEAASGSVDGDCKSGGDARLLATIVAELPAYSSALIAIGGGKDAKAEGFVIGDEIGSEGRITAIDQKKVCLDGGACLCMGTEGLAKAGGPAAKGEEAGEGGVQKLSDTKFQVDQSVLDEAMGNFESLAGQIRVVPHKDGSGNVDGYRLSAIRRGSLFDKLGIKNGDIVHAVNGQALTSTEGALSTYQTLKNERAFNFEITRRNQRQTLEYEVR